MQKFSATFANLIELKAYTFKYALNLQEIYLEHCHIEGIEDYAFDGSTNLKSLNLRGNKLERIEKFTFAGLLSLDALDLSQKQLMEVDADAFNLPKLTKLTLYSNKLQRLNNALDSLANVQIVWLFANLIVDFDLKRATKLPNLTELNLSESGFDFSTFSVSPTDANASNSKLKNLNLMKTNITDGIIFSKLKLFPNLETLYLGENPFTMLDLEEIRTGGLSTLKEILVDNNNIDREWLVPEARKLAMKLSNQWSSLGGVPFRSVYKITVSNKLQFAADFETVLKLE